jgi:hypothetical protein
MIGQDIHASSYGDHESDVAERDCSIPTVSIGQSTTLERW